MYIGLVSPRFFYSTLVSSFAPSWIRSKLCEISYLHRSGKFNYREYTTICRLKNRINVWKISMFELVISTYRRKTKNITLNLFKTKMNQFSFIGLFFIPGYIDWKNSFRFACKSFESIGLNSYRLYSLIFARWCPTRAKWAKIKLGDYFPCIEYSICIGLYLHKYIVNIF